MKKTGVFLLLLCLLGLMLPGAQAAEADSMVYITRGEYYDTEQQVFVYPIEEMNGVHIFSTAANEMVVTDPVTVSADPGVEFTLYRDGEAVSEPRTTQSRAGSYAVCVTTNSGGAQTVLSFTIISAVSSNLTRYKIPTGFQVTAVTRNEEKQDIGDGYTVDFSEGIYRVSYRCMNTGLTYELCTTIDQTPPSLRLDAVNENGVARAAVDISDLESGDTVVIRRNGQNIAYSEVLSDSGSYYIRITDPAGNAVEYTFRIHAYLNGSAILFFLVILIVVGGLLVYLMRERKHIRVR